ncbi:MAG: GGDEF domain-containing protein [Clostridiales bacterium]|nr:GGDEF domain-containing protein [Clostridiales bacterium]
MKICAFIGDMYRDYSSELILAIQKCAIERGHRVDVFGNCSVPSENPLHAEGLKKILSLPNYSDYDGIILCSDTLHHAGLNYELLEKLTSATDLPPVVSVRAEESGFYAVIPDNRQIMYEISKYVIGKVGCDDIGFVTGRDDLRDSLERLAGFEDAMEEAGYKINKNMIFHGNYWTNQGPETADFFTREDGSLPKAIICSNDYMAIALTDELMNRGYSIPKDTMITGIDNLDASSAHVPSITTSDIPETVLGRTAVEYLEKIHSGEDVDICTTVPGRLILRESTGDAMSTRDIDEMHRRLDAIQQNYYDKTRAFVLLSSDYEDVLSYDVLVNYTLEQLDSYDLFSRILLCKYCENDRQMVGFCQDHKSNRTNTDFPSSLLFPEEFENSKPGLNIFLPVFYKSEVYGYIAFSLKSDVKYILDEKMEFTMVLLGQTLNRLRLYDKLFEVNNIKDLYIRDALTGLLNRRGFEQGIANYFVDGHTKDCNIAVASIDMDGLKDINDNLGHASGDEALKGIAHCLESSLKEGEIAARIGGDEFEAVLVLNSPARIGQFIRTFRNAIKKANTENRAEYTLSASIGTCEVSEWELLMECMNKADKVMYIEKKTKKHRT